MLLVRQDAEGKEREKTERLRFGRFWYRFPHGESGADVYDRMTIFEDHMIRDINAGRFSNNTSLVLVTHGLALRVFLMRCARRQVHSPLRSRCSGPHAVSDCATSTLTPIRQNIPLYCEMMLGRFFHWTVDQFLEVFNPPNAVVRLSPC